MTPHPSRWILTSSLLLASTALAQPIPQELSVGVGELQSLSVFRASDLATTLEASYMRGAGPEGFWRSVYLGGGLRFAVPLSHTTFPLEGFVRGELRTRLGAWEPAAGLEVGASRVARLPTNLRLPAEVAAREVPRLGPLYLGITVSPLRFHVGPVVLGGPEVQLGPAGPPFGGVTRLRVGLLKVEVPL